MRSSFLSIAGSFCTSKAGIHILNGHRVQDEIEPQTFIRLLDELNKEVNFVRIEDAIKMICNHENPSCPYVAFTFDDGFMDCYDIFAPVLESYGINAAFFINPNYVEGNEAYVDHFNNHIVLTPNKHPMRWTHIKDLQNRGFIIGAHTMDHFLTANNDMRSLEYQIVECKKTIEEKLGVTCELFAWPYGRLEHTNQKAVDMACKIYKYVFSQSDYRHYFSFDGKVINRRHFEPFWPVSHVKYFLSCKKTY